MSRHPATPARTFANSLLQPGQRRADASPASVCEEHAYTREGTARSVHLQMSEPQYVCTRLVTLAEPQTHNVIGDLQIEGVISRSPSPLPLEERAVEDLSPEELRELVRRQRERESDRSHSIKPEWKGLKRERSMTIISDGETSDAGEISVESAARSRQKKPRKGSVEVETIDLSGD